jgi:catalase
MTDTQAAHAMLEELPFGKAHLMTFQLTPIGPLNPLRQLLVQQMTTMNTRKEPAMATTPESSVDALNSAWGKQTTQRSAHAKGVVLLGKFVPSAEAASVSKALHFKHEVPVTARFSANSGMPKIADADPRAAPRGLAIKFRLPDGSDTDLVTHSYNGFFAKNPEEFQQFFLAVAGSKPGVPSPTPIEAFQETHPAAKAFLTTRDPPPVSYATTAYFGVNSFKFVNEKGAVTIGRYQLLPDAGRHFLAKDESAKAATNYLEDEIRQRVARGAVRFTVVLQLAEPGDKIDDPSVAWASTNKITTLGTLTVASVVPDSEATERALMFLPALLPAGIESADPMIQFRNEAYPVSYERRQSQPSGHAL